MRLALLPVLLLLAGSAIADFTVLTDTTAVPILCADLPAPGQLICGLCSKFGLKTSVDTANAQSKFEAVCTACSNGKTPTATTNAQVTISTATIGTTGYKLNLTESCVIATSSRAHIMALSLALLALLAFH